MLLQCELDDSADNGIAEPVIDYIGFKVESSEEFAKDVEEIADNNPLIAPSPVGSGPEGAKRLEMFKRTSIGSYHLADPDGILIDVIE